MNWKTSREFTTSPAIGFLFLLLSAAPGEAFQFRSATNYTVTGHIDEIAAGDFNNDGRLDIVSANTTSTIELLVGNGDGSFAAPLSFGLPTTPRGVAVGDFNSDGNLDILSVNDHPTRSYSVLLGDGTNGFTISTVGFSTNSYISAYGVAAGDINGDGSQDFAVCGIGLHVYTNKGNGSFAFSTNYAVGNPSYDISMAKLNGDNALDLVTSDYSSSSMTVLMNDRSGTFFAPTNYSGDFSEYHYGVVARDFDGDGETDLATINYYSGTVAVRLSTRWGHYGAEIRYPVGSAPYAMGSADFNGDGFLDLVSTAQFANPRVLAFLPGKGDGTFGTAVTNFSGTGAQFLIVEDFNADGRPDLATAHNNGGSSAISIWINEMEPRIQILSVALKGATNVVFTNPPPTSYTVGSLPRNAALADFTHDGAPDIATPDSSGNRVSVMLNNGSGDFGVVTNYPVAATGGAYCVAHGDFNNDGNIDLVAGSETAGVFGVLLGKGDGSFDGYTNYSANGNPRVLVTGDFDNDTNIDLLAAVTNPGEGIGFFKGEGDGSFATVSNISAIGALSMAAGHFNSDRNLDLVTVNHNNGLRLLLGNGDGTFTTNGILLLGGPVAVSDFNADGKSDVATTRFDSTLILMGNGEGGFVSTNTVPKILAPMASDLNMDGIADLAGIANGALTAILSTRDGTFNVQTNLFPSFGATFVTSADLDGDGRNDLVTTVGNANTLRRYFNRTAPATAGPIVLGDPIKLVWPAWQGYVLEYSTNLTQLNGWIPVTNSVSSIGAANVITSSVEEADRFYRLRRP